MPLHKKITTVVVFALCGFLGGFVSQANAATSITISGAAGHIAEYASMGNTFGCVFTGNGIIDAGHDLGFNAGGTAWIVYGGASLGVVGQFSPLISSPGYYTVIGMNGGSGSCSAHYSDYAYIGAFYWDGSSAGPPTTASTTINSIAPSGTIASSSPITITITGALGTTDLASTTAAGNTVRLLSWVGGVDTSFISPSQSWTLSTDGSFTKTYQVTTDLPAGNFKIYASITSAGTYDCSAIDTGGVCVPIGGVNVATTTYFTLNSSYFEHITGTSTPTNLYTPQPCGISDLSGCFQNALAALFYPKSSPGSTFAAISDEARGKFPFVYIYQLGAIRTSLLSASSTAPTGLTVNIWKIPGQATSTIELISQTKVASVPFSGTIYTVLTWLIWLLMAEYIYVRVIKMHDTTTPSS